MKRYQEPEYLPWDGRRVPLTFLSGYLGSGKTTLINRLLATTDRPIAVMVNDVGQVNIDARLIRRRHGNTIELTDGCVCCSLSDGFGAAFDQLREQSTPPDHVVVELSGVAEPDRVLPWARSAGFKLDGVLTMVAADQLEELLAEPIAQLTITKQLLSADLIVLTKVESLSSGQRSAVECNVRELIAHGVTEGLASGDRDPTTTPVVTTDEPNLTTTLLHLGGRHASDLQSLPAPTLFDTHTTDLVPLPDPIERHELDNLLQTLGPDVVRAKGIACDKAGRRWNIQVVGRRSVITELPDAELEDPTDLVVIRVS